MLTSRQRSKLAGLAQDLEPQLHLGRGGASAGIESQLDKLLSDHELVKMRFVDFKESRHEMAQELAQHTGAEIVRVIGNVAVLWRRSHNPEKRRIDLED
jgi:RNA-binding protein